MYRLFLLVGAYSQTEHNKQFIKSMGIQESIKTSVRDKLLLYILSNIKMIFIFYSLNFFYNESLR